MSRNIPTLKLLLIWKVQGREMDCLGSVEIFHRFWHFSAGIKMAFSVEREIFVSSYCMMAVRAVCIK